MLLLIFSKITALCDARMVILEQTGTKKKLAVLAPTDVIPIFRDDIAP